jgi:gliding motility-associated-like protein
MAASATSSTATTVSARSTPTFTTQPGAAACANADVTYTTEPGQTNYVWIVPGTLNTDYNIVSGGIDNASNTVTLKWLTAGVKSVTINYTNSNNCNAVVATSSTATTISARPIPAFTTQPGATACPNADVTYTTEAGQSNYVWIVPGILNTDYSITSGGIGTTSNTVTLKWLTTGIKTVTINYTNSNSCTAASATSSTATTVSARPAPTFTTQPGATVCANTNVTYTTEPGQTNYIWTGFGTINTDYTITSGGTAITNTVTLKWLTAGVKTVAINYSNSNNCTALSATSSSATTVNAAPIPTFIAQPGASACPNADVTYTTQSSQSNYIWVIPGAPYIDYFISGGSTTSNTVTLRWLTTGSKTVTINYTNSNSCIAESATSSTATVVNALPSPSFIAQPGANACPGIDVTYSTQSGQGNYIWTVPGTLTTDYTITSGGLGTASNTVTLKWLTTGTKTVTINYSNSNNCTAASATSSTATIVNALPTPSFIAQAAATVCASASVTYTTESSQTNYIWTFPGTLNTDYTIISGGGTSSNTVTLKWLTAGSKIVTINYTNSNSCTAASATSSSATTVNALPTPSFIVQPGLSACPNAGVVYTTQSSQTNYIWSVPGTLNTDYSIISGGIDNASNTVTLKWLSTGTKTVTINYTNSNSCTAIAATSSLATVVNALPSPSFIVQPGVTECPNTDVTYSTQPSQTNYIWSVPGILNTDYSITSGGIGNTSNTVTLKWLTSGSKTVTINYSNSNNCTAASATSSTATTIRAINTVGNASSTPTICINIALTNITHLTTGATGIANSGITGTNGLPAGVSASWASNTITISGTPSLSGTFNYSIPLTGGCGLIKATGSIVVTANNVVTFTSAAGTNNQTNCINTAIASIAYSTTGATGITFAGLPAGVTGGSSSNKVTISGTPSIAGVFNYTVALTGGCGVISAQGTIKVNALPVAAIISPSTTLLTCSTTTINLTATGGISYLWSNGLGSASTSSITAPGTYMVTVTDANICSSTTSITITQNIVVPSSYAVTGTGSYCSGGAGLPIGLAGSQIGVSYQLQENGINSGIAIAGTGSAINFGNKLAAGTYSVIATNTISSCTKTMTGTALVKVLNLPVAGLITGATIQCAGVVGQTYKIASISNATTYTWTVPIGWIINSIQGDTLLSVTTGQVGQDGVIKLVPGNICGLGSAATLAVAVLPMSTSSISSGSANQTICINTALANTVFSTTGATSASFTGLPAGVIGNWTNNTIRLSGSPTLAGSFIYTISLLGGCKIVDQTGTINVIPDNKISLSSTAATDSQNICIGNAITQIEYATVSATSIIVTGLPAGLQAIYASNKITIAGTPTVVGVYNYTILLQGGCGQVTKNGTVNIHALPTGTVAASNNGIICEGATVLLSATGGNSYQWFFNGNLIAGVIAASYSASLPGMYSVKLISDKGCANFVKNTPTLVLNSAPVAGFSFDKYCINTPINFTNTSTTNLSGPVSMLWDFGDNTSASITSPTHSFLIEKTNIVKLTITPANCPLLAKSVSKNVQIEIPPKGIKYPTVYALKNNNTQLIARAGGKIYSWSPFIGLNNPLIKSPFFNYTAPSNYQVQITNDAGCIYRDSVNVLIFDQADFFVPKAFSPNNDGHNDKLLFVMPGIEKLAYFRIFNRWGNLVFETTNVNINWDGMFRGVAQPSESYSWFAEGISNMGNKIQRNGQILLLH